MRGRYRESRGWERRHQVEQVAVGIGGRGLAQALGGGGKGQESSCRALRGRLGPCGTMSSEGGGKCPCKSLKPVRGGEYPQRSMLWGGGCWHSTMIYSPRAHDPQWCSLQGVLPLLVQTRGHVSPDRLQVRQLCIKQTATLRRKHAGLHWALSLLIFQKIIPYGI